MKSSSRVSRLVSVFVIAACGAFARVDGQRPPPALSEVEAAAWHTPYRGIETLGNGRLNAQFEIFQRADGRRMVRPLRGAGPIEVDDGIFSFRSMPRRSMVVVRPSGAARVRTRGLRLDRASMTYVGAAIIAGRQTSIYRVRRPSGGQTIQLWVDDVSLVPLRATGGGPNGDAVQWEFAQIQYGAPPGFQFVWPAGSSIGVRHWSDGIADGAVEPLRMSVALPRALPLGMLYDGAWERELAGREALWLHFHQGTWSASLFETPASTAPAPPPPDPGARETVVSWNLGGLNLTLVSNLPAPARDRMRAAVRLVHVE